MHPISMGELRFRLWRQDDNGNRVLIREYADREAAELARDEMQARGHKQLYWVEPDAPPR
jgi:hypothetical protein